MSQATLGRSTSLCAAAQPAAQRWSPRLVNLYDRLTKRPSRIRSSSSPACANWSSTPTPSELGASCGKLENDSCFSQREERPIPGFQLFRNRSVNPHSHCRKAFSSAPSTLTIKLASPPSTGTRDLAGRGASVKVTHQNSAPTSMHALRILFLTLAVALLGLLGWRLAAKHPQVAEVIPARDGKPQPVAPSHVATPEERLQEVPEFASFYGKLRSDFPSDYSAFVDQMAKGATMPTGNAAIWDAMRDLQQSQGILAAQAGPAALDGYFGARQAVLDGLAPLNARECVDFLYGFTNPSIADFTEAHRGLVATLADRQLAAIEDGRSRHLDRSSPTNADLDALSAALTTRQVSAQEIGVLLDGATPDPPLTDTRLCALGRLYLDALRGLPANMRQRIYGLAAELLARS